MVFDPFAVCCMAPFFLVGVFLIYNGATQYLIIQKIRNTPTSKVRSLALGLAEVFGKAKSKIRSISPISKVQSPYWMVVAQYYQPGKHGGWRDLYHSQSQNIFYLEDETGKVEIDPKDADIKIPEDMSFQGYLTPRKKTEILGLTLLNEYKQLDKPVLDFIETLDEASKKRFYDYDGYNISVKEYYIAEGDPLYVLGTVMRKDGSNQSLQEENLIIGASPSNSKLMVISDSQEKNVESKFRDSMYWTIGLGVVISVIMLLVILANTF